MDAKIKDVAKLAGVSISTVSNTLSGRKKVSEDKQAAVMEAVRSLGYVPNINARLLKSRRTGNIGLFLPFIDGPFYSSLMQEVYHACSDFGYGMFTHVARDFDSQETAATILSCNIDAAIVLNDHLLDPEIETLIARGLPLVCCDRNIQRSGVSSVTLDNKAGTFQQVAYLAHTGHRKIIYLRGRNNYDGDERYSAYLEAMSKAGLTVEEGSIMEGLFSRKVAYNCVYGYLMDKTKTMPDAFLCANDEMAFGCIDALKDLDYSVPRDVSVIGFDDLDTNLVTPPLTTIGYALRDFAHMAVEEAVRLIQDPSSNGVCRTLDTEIRIRNSASFRIGKVPKL